RFCASAEVAASASARPAPRASAALASRYGCISFLPYRPHFIWDDRESLTSSGPCDKGPTRLARTSPLRSKDAIQEVRLRIRYAALAVAVVVAGYVGYWFWVAGKVERGVLRWADERRAEGFEVGWRSFDIGGFPFRLVLTFEEPRLAQPGHRLAPEWRGERVIALMYPWNLRYVLAGFEGEQTLSFRDEG